MRYYLICLCFLLAPAAFAAPVFRHLDPALSTPACQDFLHFNQEGLRTYGLVVLRHGQPVLEMYDHNADEKKLFKLWSISKLVTGLLVGTEIQKGRLSLDTKISSLFPNFSHETDLDESFRGRLRVRHLWTLGSGLDWCETDICDLSPSLSLYYGEGRRDALQFTLGRSYFHNPGTYYNYGSGDVTILSAVLRRLHSEQKYERLPEENLFGPLGIRHWAIERDLKGVYLLGSNLYLATNDLAKIGQLVLQEGVWKDPETGRETRLLSRDFYREMVTVNRPIRSIDTPEPIRFSEGPLGGLLWLNYKVPGLHQALRSAPENTRFMLGNYGQNLLVFPGAGVVVARNGADADFFPLLDTLADKAVRCFSPAEWDNPSQKKKYPEPKASLIQLYGTFKTMRDENIVTRLFAQETCSCLFVEGFSSVEECRARLPQKDAYQYFSPKVTVDFEHRKVTVHTDFRDPTGFLLGSFPGQAVAKYAPRWAHDGCELED